jgi:hypothetical protein
LESGIFSIGEKQMSETEVLIKKTETLPPALFEEAVHYIDYLSQKAQAACFAEKLAEAEHEAAKPNALWLDETDFWSGDD